MNMDGIQGRSCWSLRFWWLKLSLVSTGSLDGFSMFCVSVLFVMPVVLVETSRILCVDVVRADVFALFPVLKEKHLLFDC